MEGTVGAHLRSNIVGYVALFFVFTGGAYALQGKNTVDSGDIKKGQVKNSDLAANAVDSTKIADNAITGADIDESSLSLPIAGPQSSAPTGAAGGDLVGTYPDPQIAAGAVGAAEVADGSLTAAKIVQTTLFNDNSLDAADVDESTLFNDNSLSGADVDESTLYNDDSLAAADLAPNSVGSSEVATSAVGTLEIADGSIGTADVGGDALNTSDIDDSTLNVGSLNGTRTAVVNVHQGANTVSTSLFPDSLLPLNATCTAGEATLTIDDFVNAPVASYADTGATDPTFQTIAAGNTSSAIAASPHDLIIWQAANNGGPNPNLVNQATYVIAVDEGGAGCDFYVRAFFQNQS
jgi:hypothetical protein